METSPRWYAVHTGAGKERLANINLRRQGYFTFYPIQRIRRRRKMPNRITYTVETVEVPYFPRYLFVALRHPHESLYGVNETIGVSTVVYCGQEPLEIPHSVMDDLMDRADGSGAMGSVDRVARKRFHPGTTIQFRDDSVFAHFIATVSVDKGTEVRVWVEFFGEKRELRVSPDIIADIAS